MNAHHVAADDFLVAVEQSTNWEEAVRWYRCLPDNEKHVRDNYFDLPVVNAAERYSGSDEFREVLRILGPGNGKTVLDVGAGNGIASFALAKNGWAVTALEPDPSEEVGAGAIRCLAQINNLSITVVQGWGERLPFTDACFDAIFARQVLHHARDLADMMRDLARTMKSGGQLLSIRDHVCDNTQQLNAFLAAHPLHHLYGGENAFSIDAYRSAFNHAGLVIDRELGPLQSIMNFFPGTQDELRSLTNDIARSRWRQLGRLLAWLPQFQRAQLLRYQSQDTSPGRLYSFLARKPAAIVAPAPKITQERAS